MSKAEEIKKGRVDSLIADDTLHFIQFKGLAMWRHPDVEGYIPLRSDDFARLVYGKFSGISKNGIDDLLHALRTTAPDRTDWGDRVAFGDKVWDMRELKFIPFTLDYVYATPLKPKGDRKAAWKFLTELADGDEDLAKDYLQAMAPLYMTRKPTGVIWFVGSGSNGKSALINALYRIMGRYFTSMTTSAIEDGRDTPRLNGVLGNICRESSESRVEDTERYKAIGTHEPFTVHKFHSQDTVVIDTSFHTIFNANNVPVFSDKTKGARRRTLILPFPAHFRDDPSFEDKTFTPEFLAGMLELILETTHTIRDNGYRYKWSDATIRAKESYDHDVNSAEAFLDYLKESGVVGFYNYAMLKLNYENWCAHNGLIPLGVTTLKRTLINEAGVIRKSVRTGGVVAQRYQFLTAADDTLVWLDNGYGLRSVDEAKVVKEVEEKQSALSKDW